MTIAARPFGPWRRLALYVPTLLIDLLGAVVVLTIWALWGKSLHVTGGAVVAVMRASSWPARTWYRRWGGTTLGHFIFVKEGCEHVLDHELVHVEQVEAHGVVGFLLGLGSLLAGSWVVALALWGCMHVVLYAGAAIVAWFRGEDPYRGNYLEEAAYNAEKK